MAAIDIPAPTQIAHVVLRTTLENHPKMMEFYKTFLGGSVTAQVKAMGFVTFDSEHHRIALLGIPGVNPKDPQTCGLEHVSFTFKDLDDLLNAYRGRKAQGIDPVWCVNHGATLSIYYKDPDGNTLETQIDILDTIDAVNEFIASEDFKENPYGVDFDPEDILVKKGQGVPYAKLIKRERLGPRSFDTVPIKS